MKYLLALIVCLAFASCASVKDAERTEDVPSCTAVVEGTFETPILFRSRGNALVLAKGRDEMRLRHGKVLSMDSTGILFDEDREFSWSDPEPKRYAYDEVSCLVDSAQRVIYGTPPTALRAAWDVDMTFRLADDTTAMPIRFRFEIGERFSFCMPPGRYKLTDIHMLRYDKVAWGMFIPELTFTAAKGFVNYIGELRMDNDSSGAPGSCLFVCRVEDLNNGGWGSMFGLAGALVDVMTRDYGVKDGHLLRVVQDPAYRSGFALPLRPAEVTFRMNPLMAPAKGEIH